MIHHRLNDELRNGFMTYESELKAAVKTFLEHQSNNPPAKMAMVSARVSSSGMAPQQRRKVDAEMPKTVKGKGKKRDRETDASDDEGSLNPTDADPPRKKPRPKLVLKLTPRPATTSTNGESPSSAPTSAQDGPDTGSFDRSEQNDIEMEDGTATTEHTETASKADGRQGHSDHTPEIDNSQEGGHHSRAASVDPNARLAPTRESSVIAQTTNDPLPLQKDERRLTDSQDDQIVGGVSEEDRASTLRESTPQLTDRSEQVSEPDVDAHVDAVAKASAALIAANPAPGVPDVQRTPDERQMSAAGRTQIYSFGIWIANLATGVRDKTTAMLTAKSMYRICIFLAMKWVEFGAPASIRDALHRRDNQRLYALVRPLLQQMGVPQDFVEAMDSALVIDAFTELLTTANPWVDIPAAEGELEETHEHERANQSIDSTTVEDTTMTPATSGPDDVSDPLAANVARARDDFHAAMLQRSGSKDIISPAGNASTPPTDTPSPAPRLP
ncbi:hypothetical protein KC323_g8030 [Hortaea werneckii]|nr:hypothetical protein KC323_g8030 [Hortaea werneckii]